MTTSPTRTKQKLSLRKRLFVKKSPKVGCYVDTDSADEFTQPASRPISPVDPFLAQSAQHINYSGELSDTVRNSTGELTVNNLSRDTERTHQDDENNQKCCKTFFKRSRPKSLVEGNISKVEVVSGPCSPANNGNSSLDDQAIYSHHSKSDEIAKASIKFRNKDDMKKSFEHSGSFEGIKTKNKLFVKRLSADHLITNDTKPLYRSSSPESDRSNSLDRKRRYVILSYNLQRCVFKLYYK